MSGETPIKKKIINLHRYMTLDEVAQELGLSRERTRQIEKIALAKLRRAFEVRGLSYEDLLPEKEKILEDPNAITIRVED